MRYLISRWLKYQGYYKLWKVIYFFVYLLTHFYILIEEGMYYGITHVRSAVGLPGAQLCHLKKMLQEFEITCIHYHEKVWSEQEPHG